MVKRIRKEALATVKGLYEDIKPHIPRTKKELEVKLKVLRTKHPFGATPTWKKFGIKIPKKMIRGRKRFCPKCKVLLSQEDFYCPYCGRRVR